MLKHVIRKATAILSRRFRSRTVWFTRTNDIRPYGFNNGGNLKHSHYFDHVQRTPGFARKIVFHDKFSKECTNSHALWPSDSPPRFEPNARDVLFLAGLDWRFLVENGMDSLPNPKINLIQHVRHANQGTEYYRYLAYRAIRICVSQEVADAISATSQINGPVITIPNGTDVTPVNPARALPRLRPVTIVGYKRPDLALALSRCLNEQQIAHPPSTEFIERHLFIDQLTESRVAVCLEPISKSPSGIVGHQSMTLTN